VKFSLRKQKDKGINISSSNQRERERERDRGERETEEREREEKILFSRPRLLLIGIHHNKYNNLFLEQVWRSQE